MFRTDNYIFDYMKDENYAFNNTESLPRNEGNIDSSESQKPLFKNVLMGIITKELNVLIVIILLKKDPH